MAVELAPQIGDFQLDKILELKEPARTNIIRRWAEHFDEKYRGQVLIKASGGSTFKASYRGQTIKIPPAGVRVDRKIAIYLLNKYGKNGIYYGMDQATGMTPGHWAGLNEEQRSKYGDKEPNYIKYYLTHVPDNPNERDDPMAGITPVEDADEE